MRLSPRDIIARISGVSTPIGGISWEPSIHVPEHDIAERLIRYLEDRRALYNPYELEVMYPVIESVLQIRARLTEDLQKLDRSSSLAESIAAMRAACRKFLDSVGYHASGKGPSASFGPHHWISFVALGELRGVFGIHIALIASRYDIDVEEQLAAIFPEPPDNDDYDNDT